MKLGSRRVRGVHITTTLPDLLPGFNVYVATGTKHAETRGLSLPQTLQVCHDQGTSVPTDEMEMSCNGILFGDLIIIRVPGRPAQITLCEVAVYGDCQAGVYGDDCLSLCGHCVGGSTTCDKITGACPDSLCAAGWQGDMCLQECPHGFWGSECSSDCGQCYHTPCDHVNGSCLGNRCKAGYKSTYMCNDECDDHHYSIGCNGTCSRNCRGDTPCNKENGHCPRGLCNPGWQGQKCDQECDDHRYGIGCNDTCSRNCRGHTPCNKTNGHCPGGLCNPGWQGQKCDQECDDHSYGIGCNGTCSRNCRGDTPCNKENGHCPAGSCNHGWQGQKCDQECQSGYWGLECSSECGECYNNTCDHINGLCPGNRCKAGYKSTEMCKEECDDHAYGIDCNDTCSHNCRDDANCHNINGHCPDGKCKQGWQGQRCDQVCAEGFYGENCEHECGKCGGETACHRVDGSCMDGCVAQWHGHMCQTYQAPEESSPAVGIGLGVAAAIVAAVAAAFIFIIYRRRRHLHQEYEEAGQPFSRVADTRNNGEYENVVTVPDGSANGMYVNCAQAQYANCESLHGKPPIPVKEVQQSEERHEQTPVEYDNARACTSHPSAVELSNLRQDIYNHAAGGVFTGEYGELPVGLQSPTEVALQPPNRAKNRYKNMYPYDFNRVVLKLLDGQPNSDYINASYINGCDREDVYIASQGPTTNNIEDFVRMIWEVQTETIVMLTGCVERGAAKCMQYWPNNGEMTFGDVTVSMVTEEVFADFTIRKLAITMGGGERRTIQHYQFTSWPDKDVPAEPYGLLRLHGEVRKTGSGHSHPILVHCSAGVGRTGTYIAFDCLYEEGISSGAVAILPRVKEIRRQRILMVQTEKQYQFLHELLYGALVSHCPAIAVDEFLTAYTRLRQIDGTTGKTKLATLFQKIQDNELRLPEKATAGDDTKADEYASARLAENVEKNRNNEILASDRYRPYLSIPVDGCNDYINAVYIQTYIQSRGLIITQLPLPHTAVDFCRLMYQTEVELVVTFIDAAMVQKDPWLHGSKEEHGPFVMTSSTTTDENYFTTRHINMTNTQTKSTKSLKQYMFTKSLPSGQTDIEALIALLTSVEADARRGSDDTPVVVQCMNGCAQSGVFCVLWNVLERMRFDNEVAIPQTINQGRTRRKELISNYEQFKLCYDVILNYIESHSVYGNV